MKIGVISDTHNKESTMISALDLFVKERVSYVVHCGDWTATSAVVCFASEAEKRNLPIKAVLGNRDVERDEILKVNSKLPVPIDFVENDIFESSISDKRIAVYHGHHKPTLQKLIESEINDVLFTGHTHKPRIVQEGRTLIINPGSTAFTIPRTKNSPPSVVVYSSERNDGKIILF